MSNDQMAGEAAAAANAASAAYVQLFQKAHQKILLLDRLEEQLAQLVAKRQELQDELRDVQSQINAELEHRITSCGEPAARLLSAVVGASSNNGGGAATIPMAMPVGAGAQRGRFATQSLTNLGGDE
jgi:TolA-binding protein